jgi:myo-inositol-1(or 4)-monophosphatase
LPGPDDLALLTDAAVAAGALALRMRAAGVRTTLKSDNSPVTEADLAVNDLLHARLTAARPGHGWLSEETPDSADRLTRDRVFIVDPIDGTRAFVAGEDDFAHALAVAEGGRIVAAVVHLPARGQTYAATLDGAATLNGVPLALRAPPAVATVLAGRPSLAPEKWPRGLPPHDRAFRAAMQVRLCLLAEGRADAVIALNHVAEWDSGAGALIATRAGAVASSGDGRPLRFNQADPRGPGLIVAAPALHADLILRRGTGGA